MNKKEECWTCGSKCWWQDCPNSADYSLDVALKRNGLPLYDGQVDLCAGHTAYANRNGGRLNLNWDAIEQALSLIKASA